MRKFLYARWLKVAAVILFAACIAAGMLTVTDGIVTYMNEPLELYSLEEDHSDSWYFSELLSEPESAVYRACCSVLKNPFRSHNVDMYSDEIEREIQEIFEDHAYEDRINYYICWNDTVVTNTAAKAPEELATGSFYSYFKKDRSGTVEHRSSHDTESYLLVDLLQGSESVVTVSCNIKESAIEEGKEIWERQKNIVFGTAVRALVCTAVALVFFVYLLCVCGKNREGLCKSCWLDRTWLEARLAATVAIGIGAAAGWIFLVEEYRWEQLPLNLILVGVGAVSALGSLGLLTGILSVVRNIRTKTAGETSVLLRSLKWIWKKGKAFAKAVVKGLSQKSGVICLSMLLVYTALIGLMGMGTPESPVWLMLGILLFGVAAFVVIYRVRDVEEIKKGIREVRSGNAAYRIPEPKCEDMKQLCADVNDIAKGIDSAVAAKVKAERLKSELITNVSHDLKTPITSIINYTQLLSRMEDLPEEARDYVAIIGKKSDRLKKLTQDLFDISKVQSGNEEVLLEKLDVALLLIQAMGEHDNEIRTSGFSFCVETPRELYILADGRKMSRVLSNLLSNALKYAMKGTRVFVTASEKDGTVTMEFKNISAYPLDFDTEEITQRFVRGDESRTAEGNGLGLAIAKSYTELCGGVFEIVTDGDLFKAIIKFPKLP